MTSDFENQLDKIRVDLYEQTKTMTNGEAVRAMNENARTIAEQYGIKIVKGNAASVEKRVRAL